MKRNSSKSELLGLTVTNCHDLQSPRIP